jgi:hypothetical protein
MSFYTKDHLGVELSSDEIVEILSKMLGFSTKVPWTSCENALRAQKSLLENYLKKDSISIK